MEITEKSYARSHSTSVTQNLGLISSMLNWDKVALLIAAAVAVSNDLVFYLGEGEEDVEQRSLKGKEDAFVESE